MQTLEMSDKLLAKLSIKGEKSPLFESSQSALQVEENLAKGFKGLPADEKVSLRRLKNLMDCEAAAIVFVLI